VPLEVVLAVSRAAGLCRYDAEQPVYRDDDIETFQIFSAGVDVFGEAATLEFTQGERRRDRVLAARHASAEGS